MAMIEPGRNFDALKMCRFRCTAFMVGAGPNIRKIWSGCVSADRQLHAKFGESKAEFATKQLCRHVCRDKLLTESGMVLVCVRGRKEERI